MNIMEFKNVTVVKKANIYFDGKVSSRTVVFENGEKKTLGLMLAGEYEFNTAAKEIMEVLNGEMDIMLADEKEYKTYKANESFEVKANSSFKIIVKEFADYCCSYIEETL